MLSRRRLLQGLAGSAASAHFPLRLFAANTTATVLIVLVARSTNALAERLTRALAPFQARGMAVGVALPEDSPPLPTDLGRATPLNAAFCAPDPLPAMPYFQMRALSRARSTLARALPPGAQLNTLCAPDPGGDVDLRGLRIAGFRSALLMPEDSAPTTLETQHSQTVVARGGHWARPGAAAALRAYLDDTVAAPDRVHASIFVDLDPDPETAGAQAAEVAATIAGAAARNAIATLAPQELGVRHFSYFERRIGVLLDLPPEAQDDPAAQAALAALSRSLTAAGIAHSVARRPDEALEAGDCLRIGATSDAGALPRGLACALMPASAPGLIHQLADLGTMAVVDPPGATFFGLDGDGIVHLRANERAATRQEIEAIVARLSLVDEPVIVLDAAGFTTPAQRNAATAALRTLAELAGTRIDDLAGYGTRLLNAGPEFDTMRETRLAAPRIAPVDAGPLSPEARAAFLDDARRAWRYFEELTAEASGMPSASCQFQPSGALGPTYDQLTQWDVGSVIFGWLAALDLGLIEAEAFAVWRDKLLATLRANTLTTAPHLPCGTYPITAPNQRSRDYNARDAGRLLSALTALAQRAPAGDTAIPDLVASWDLRATIIDGVPQSFERGRMIPEPDSHCSSYMARSFRRWGLTARSPYSRYYLGETETDHRMHLLDKVAEIGNFGAEPLLLEALECGWTTPLAYLADVLFAAQLDAHEATGQMFAPSETSREVAPWFTYQGLRVDVFGEARWDVMVPGGGSAYETPEFRHDTRMVVTKAAYLWAAARPHPYSDLLLGYVRAHAALPGGFASGVYTADDRPTTDYSDVNTNGIILQAIARILAA